MFGGSSLGSDILIGSLAIGTDVDVEYTKVEEQACNKRYLVKLWKLSLKVVHYISRVLIGEYSMFFWETINIKGKFECVY